MRRNDLTSNSKAVIKKLNIMKKQYQQPISEAIIMEPSSILCASSFIDPSPGDDMWGA
jgi:hypothetical protein